MKRALFIAAVALTGCGDCGSGNGAPDAGPGEVDASVPRCESRDDCEGGQVCVDGVCDFCQLDRDCRGDEICNPVLRICEFLPCFGGNCRVHADCSLGEFCVQGLCRPPSGDECGEVVACANDTSCAEGEACNTATLVCELDTGCFGDAACPDGFYCDLDVNQCREACTEENVDELCGISFQCIDGRCRECATDADCPGDLVCTGAGRCVSEDACLTDRDCPRPEVCNRQTKQCTVKPPPCVSNDDCLIEEVCEIRTGRCVIAACLPDALEPNEIFAEGAAVAPGLLSNLTLCDFEVDWYRLSLGAGDRVSATVNPPPLAGQGFTTTLYDTSGARALAGGNLQVDATVPAAGDYGLLISTTDARATYSVQILVSRGVPCEEDPWEPNDGFTEASVLAPGDYFNVQKCPGNRDWFEIAVERETTVRLTLSHDPLLGDLDLYAHDSDGVTLLGKSVTTSPVETIDVTETSGGRTFIEVRGDSRTQNAYDLFVEVL